ncbi:hypothetical protein [Luteipulveratus flavus]|uniref:SnoaL-like domain-containing protein n=1 Tax=Luteipulveratus flavus TaxID=3031728 RepID=A0ABT6CCS1_9MICO|nr:hypothetical protein [Luteipulveratus sp. YIM 133296]MDF8266308.1 hypothetical protein [Luteipulveratus sp. YIM 133296]
MDAVDLLRALAETIDDQRWDDLARVLSPAFSGRYVHTGETFDRDGFVAVNRDYPGSWRFVWEDVVGVGERAAGRARVFDAEETHYVATFVTADEHGIAELVEVWAEAGDAPPAGRRPGPA